MTLGKMKKLKLSRTLVELDSVSKDHKKQQYNQ